MGCANIGWEQPRLAMHKCTPHADHARTIHKCAAEAYVFEPNVASTWQTVKVMIENFLTNQWKMGVLAGATPENAFDVQVGLGSTMTGEDILNGYMNITVKVAVTRPAEFIVLTFQQKMQTS